MAERDVPYFSLAQRMVAVIVSMAAMLVGILAARLTIDEDDLLPFIIVVLIPPLLALTVWRFWCSRSSPRMTRSERQRRYATEALQAPYWQALLIYGAPAALTPIAIVALNSDTAIKFARLLTVTSPITILIAATVLHFARREARRLLGEAAA
ncbi:MAG: hypothetical protein HOP13_11510 [Alphaproteobacteria bacterium]|nr:hypothetical protein [Alphaproteobacteria bacterium]